MTHLSPSGNEAKNMTCRWTRRILDNGTACVSFSNWNSSQLPCQLNFSPIHRREMISGSFFHNTQYLSLDCSADMDWSLIILDFYFFFVAEKHLPPAAFIATDLEMRDYRVAGWVKTLRAAETRSVSCRKLHQKKKSMRNRSVELLPKYSIFRTELDLILYWKVQSFLGFYAVMFDCLSCIFVF